MAQVEIAIFELVIAESGQDFTLPCDGKANFKTSGPRDLHGVPAEWAVMLSCGCERLWCDEHKAKYHSEVMCMRCENPGGDLVHAIPITAI
jgi:hypothetical protein